jgi:hypothetical protein
LIGCFVYSIGQNLCYILQLYFWFQGIKHLLVCGLKFDKLGFKRGKSVEFSVGFAHFLGLYHKLQCR